MQMCDFTPEIYAKGEEGNPQTVTLYFPCVSLQILYRAILSSSQTKSLKSSLTPFSHSKAHMSENTVCFIFKDVQNPTASHHSHHFHTGRSHHQLSLRFLQEPPAGALPHPSLPRLYSVISLKPRSNSLYCFKLHGGPNARSHRVDTRVLAVRQACPNYCHHPYPRTLTPLCLCQPL